MVNLYFITHCNLFHYTLGRIKCLKRDFFKQVGFFSGFIGLKKKHYFPGLYTLQHDNPVFYPGFPHYQAASPDEQALVCAARELGWVFLSRTRDSLMVSELGITRQYQLLALLEFTSKRRRMSVLGELLILCPWSSLDVIGSLIVTRFCGQMRQNCLQKHCSHHSSDQDKVVIEVIEEFHSI